MSNQRTTFLKRQREQNRLDKARAKQERLAARRASAPTATKGPPIAWGEAVGGDTAEGETLDGDPSNDAEDVPDGDADVATSDVASE